MKIEAITLSRVALPLVTSFETSSHRKSHLEHILVRFQDAEGCIGWGEIASPSDPFYAPETVDTAWLIAERYLAPAVLRTEWDSPQQLAESWRKIRGHEFAKAGFDMAAWTLAATKTGTSLASSLGGTRSHVLAGVSLGIEATVDALLQRIQTHVDAGYSRVKLKISHGWDVTPVQAARSAFPDLDLQVDANGVYRSTDEDYAQLVALERFHLGMIEQPFAPRDFLSSAELQRRIHTPICLDESITTLHDLDTMLATSAGQIVNIKVSRMGGLTVARKAHDIAAAAGVPVWCGGMHEFGIGRAANIALSSLPNFTFPSDVSGSAKYYARDIIHPEVIPVNGKVAVPTSPGLGFDVDVPWIVENTVKTLTLTSGEG